MTHVESFKVEFKNTLIDVCNLHQHGIGFEITIKKMILKLLTRSTLILAFILTISCPAAAQHSKINIDSLLQTRHYTFVAEWADPFRGRMRVLNPPYEVVIKGDSLVSDLPYFGVSEMAPLTSDEAGIHFTSTSFTYAVTTKKKSRTVTMALNDQRNANKFILTVFNDGTGTLSVNSTYRDPISFRGRIRLRGN